MRLLKDMEDMLRGYGESGMVLLMDGACRLPRGRICGFCNVAVASI